jgi:hypothetical protein
MSTNPKIIFIVVLSMALFCVLGMVGCFLLIVWKLDPGLIAIMAGFTGTAMGQLGGMLNNTRTQASEPTQTQIVNTPANPVPTTDSQTL